MRVPVAACAVGLLLVAALPVRAEVNVRVAAGTVDITASEAPLSEVLRCLAEQTGMKVLYEGAEPRELVTASLPGRSPVEAVNDLLKERRLNYAMAVDATGRVSTLIVVTAVRPLGTPEVARVSTPAAPSAPPAPVLGPLRDLLEQARAPVDESPREEPASSASEPEAKAEEVPLPELLERMSVPPEASPVAIPEESLLRLLLQPGQPLSAEPHAPAGPVDKPTGAADAPKAPPVDPAEPPPR